MHSSLTSIVDLMERHGGVTTREQLLTVATRGSLDNHLVDGELIRLFPLTYCLAVDADQSEIRARAALVYLGPAAALSHLTAVGRWGLPAPSVRTIHAIVPYRQNTRPTPGLRIHRTHYYPPTVVIRGLPTTSVAASVILSWGQLNGSAQRAPALVASQRRLVTPSELREQIDINIRLRGRARASDLVTLLEAGCESELELWGYLRVFSAPGLDHAVRQRVIHLHDRSYRADLAYEAERLIVELDGRKYHSSPAQWERDIARDLALAKVGWQTVRLSHSRLTKDVRGTQRDVLAVLAARRQR